MLSANACDLAIAVHARLTFSQAKNFFKICFANGLCVAGIDQNRANQLQVIRVSRTHRPEFMSARVPISFATIFSDLRARRYRSAR